MRPLVRGNSKGIGANPGSARPELANGGGGIREAGRHSAHQARILTRLLFPGGRRKQKVLLSELSGYAVLSCLGATGHRTDRGAMVSWWYDAWRISLRAVLPFSGRSESQS